MFAFRHAVDSACELLSAELDHCYEHISITRAEAGSGAVSMGFDGYDAMASLNFDAVEVEIAKLRGQLEAIPKFDAFPPLTLRDWGYVEWAERQEAYNGMSSEELAAIPF